jgi:hypothetical protein
VFLQQRARLRRWWPATATVLLLSLLILAVWLWHTAPSLINPWHVMERVVSGHMEAATCQITALMLPIISLTLFAVIAVMVVFGFVVFRNEDRYRAIIDALATKD